MSTPVLTSTGKPLQTIPWSEKINDNRKWFEQCADYFVGISRFYGRTRANDARDLKVLYDVYNGKFPESWFLTHTDPLAAKNPQHKKFPAKIRPVSILRTNLDLLMGEYPRRPFIFQVNNLSDDGYSRFQEELKLTVHKNLMQHFQLKLQEELMQEGLLTPDGQPASEEAVQEIQQRLQSVDLPEKVKEKFMGSYKDALAIKGQKLLKRVLAETYFRQKLNKCFKHWVIAGETYSFKTVEHDQILYKPVSPLMIDYDKSPDEDFIEDGDWVVHEEFITVSDAVDLYYEELKTENIRNLETAAVFNSPTHLYDHLNNLGDVVRGGKIRKLHVVWKGKKKWGILTRLNPETGEAEQLEVDEDYKPDVKAGEHVEWFWANEIYETTKLGPDLYIRKRAFPFQRNSMANFSKTKLPYNGRKMSDLHSQNVSVLEIGLPLQIMYIIVTYTLERTIARSKGKIVLLDQNVIPRENGWDEEKFFYYSEALGYGLVNRNQVGVDKSYNQYQVLDLSLFDQIKQLIDLQMHFKAEWDDLIGISRQRKGQTYASDLVGVNERATFQSTVITDMIFNLFEEWVERELQGLLDLTRFIALEGIYKQWNDTALNNELLEIEPTEYCSADLGLVVQSSAEAIAIKNKLEANVQAMLQNNVKPSVIFSMLKSDNIVEMESKLLRMEQIQAEAEQAAAQSEQEAQRLADERQQQFAEFNELLKRQTMHEEYDRKEELEHIQGSYNTFTFQDGDANDNGVPDATEVMKLNADREKFQKEMEDRRQQRQHEKDLLDKQLQTKREEMRSKEKIARQKPKPKP